MLNMGAVDVLPQEWNMINKKDCSAIELSKFSGDGSILFDSLTGGNASLYCSS